MRTTMRETLFSVAGEPLADRFPGTRLRFGRDGIFEVEDHRVRTRRCSLVEAIGPIARDEEIGQRERHHTASAVRSSPMRSGE